MELRMWLVMRTDINMPVGKMLAQAGHGFVSALGKADAELAKAYLSDSQTKIAVQVASEAALIRVAKEAETSGIPHALIQDAGRTVFSEPTFTCCAFGPCRTDDLSSYLRRLRLL